MFPVGGLGCWLLGVGHTLSEKRGCCHGLPVATSADRKNISSIFGVLERVSPIEASLQLGAQSSKLYFGFH